MTKTGSESRRVEQGLIRDKCWLILVASQYLAGPVSQLAPIHFKVHIKVRLLTRSRPNLSSQPLLINRRWGKVPNHLNMSMSIPSSPVMQSLTTGLQLRCNYADLTYSIRCRTLRTEIIASVGPQMVEAMPGACREASWAVFTTKGMPQRAAVCRPTPNRLACPMCSPTSLTRRMRATIHKP